MVKDYVDKLLTSCKSWTGPCTSPAELKQVIKENPDKQETILAGQTVKPFTLTHKPHQ